MIKIHRIKILFEELTRKILEACFEVSNELGSGFLESVYQNALMIALKEKGLDVQAQAPLSVHYHSQPVGQFYADILVEDKVIIEIKAVSVLTGEHQSQVINYLKGTGKEIGLLINFGRPKIEYKRLRNPVIHPID
ncbi:MAG TPA: GxxExxY protein [Anaerolineales bacterium]